MQQLRSSLQTANELLKKAMDTARSAEADASAAAAAAQQEIDGMKAKLAEAAGVLNAKEELREARWVGAHSRGGSRQCGCTHHICFSSSEILSIFKKLQAGVCLK